MSNSLACGPGLLPAAAPSLAGELTLPAISAKSVATQKVRGMRRLKVSDLRLRGAVASRWHLGVVCIARQIGSPVFERQAPAILGWGPERRISEVRPREEVYPEAVSPTLGSGRPTFSLSLLVSAFRPLFPNFPLAPAKFPDNITNSHL